MNKLILLSFNQAQAFGLKPGPSLSLSTQNIEPRFYFALFSNWLLEPRKVCSQVRIRINLKPAFYEPAS